VSGCSIHCQQVCLHFDGQSFGCRHWNVEPQVPGTKHGG
jgi:hypothetical protein